MTQSQAETKSGAVTSTRTLFVVARSKSTEIVDVSPALICGGCAFGLIGLAFGYILIAFTLVTGQPEGSETSAESVTGAFAPPSGAKVAVCVPWPERMEPATMRQVTGTGVAGGTDAL